MYIALFVKGENMQNLTIPEEMNQEMNKRMDMDYRLKPDERFKEECFIKSYYKQPVKPIHMD